MNDQKLPYARHFGRAFITVGLVDPVEGGVGVVDDEWARHFAGMNHSRPVTGIGINGSTLRSSLFTSTAGQSLAFNFNYVTSDGDG